MTEIRETEGFDAWFSELEGYALRGERFDGDVEWLKSAFAAGRRAASPAPVPVASEPVAWMGYWPGAGSVNSTTELTRFRSTMENWKGAEITPLYASPQPTFNDGVEAAAKLIEGGIDRGIRTKRDTCKHNRFGWEDCELCAVDAIRALKEHHT